MTPAAVTSEMLAEMSACAYRLGMAFGAEAEAAEDGARRRELFQLFDRCFFSVRVAIGLQLRLGRDSRRSAGEDRDEAETEHPERLEREEGSDDRAERERDRESDRERATLPLLLSTLQGVARDASTLPGPRPAELPTLDELLARMGVEPASPAAPTSAPPAAAPLRSRLALSSSAAVALLPTPAPATRSPLRIRKATGPPRRR